MLLILVEPKKGGINLRKEFVEESDTVERAIVDYAKKNNIDVIIGTTGKSAAEEAFLGSVANNVIRHARICYPLICSDLSVLTCPNFYETGDKSETRTRWVKNKRKTAHLATNMGRLIRLPTREVVDPRSLSLNLDFPPPITIKSTFSRSA